MSVSLDIMKVKARASFKICISDKNLKKMKTLTGFKKGLVFKPGSPFGRIWTNSIDKLKAEGGMVIR